MTPSPVTRSKQGCQNVLSNDLKQYLDVMKKEIISAFQGEIRQVKDSLNALSEKVQNVEEGLHVVHSEIQRIDDEINSIKKNASENHQQSIEVSGKVLSEMDDRILRMNCIIILWPTRGGSVCRRKEKT